MGLFDKLKKKKEPENILYSPLSGDVVAIESLKDKTFADKVMGDGLAIMPSEGKVYSPCDGTINAILDTHHAYGMTADAGYEVLIHIGQDTVNLKGEGFTCSVKEGDHVNKGDLLGTFDISLIKSKGYNLATPVIIIAGGDYNISKKTSAKNVKAGDELLTLSK